MQQRLSFEDVKSYIEHSKTSPNKGYSFPMLPKFNNIVGNLVKKQAHVLSGLPSSGLSSFIDQNYVMSVLLQWYAEEPEKRQPLKILYYTTGTTQLKKLQTLLCNYIRLVHGYVVDIPTLNNQIGRLYDMEEKPEVMEAVEDATNFFNNVLDDEILVIRDGRVTPTDIYNDVNDVMKKCGTMSKSKFFEFDAEFEDMLTLVIVDDVDGFGEDRDGFGALRGEELHRKFIKYVEELKALYDITPVIVKPSQLGYVRSVKDTEPHYKHLGIYSKIADRGVCLYNPINEKNIKYYDADESLYITNKGTNLLRTWHVVRNSDGVDSAYEKLLFLPGTCFMLEHADTVNDLSEGINILFGDDTPFTE